MFIFLGLIVLSLWAISRSAKSMPRRCHEAPPGESKVHHWILKSKPDSKVLELICSVCGQTPGEE